MVARVLVVSNLYPPTVEGGAELIAFSEATGLAARGLDVAVLAGTFAGKELEPGSIDLDEMNGVPVYRVPIPPQDISFNFFRPAIAPYLRALIGAHQAELVHFHNVMGLGANLIRVAKEGGAKAVVTLHDHWGFCFKNTVLRNDGRVCPDPQECADCTPSVRTESGWTLPMRLRRDYVAWCLERADLLITPSAYLFGAYRAAGVNAPMERVSYGVDLAAVPAAAKPPAALVRFVCLAYMGEHKGIPVLLDAAERLAGDPALAGRWSLSLAGPGHLAGKLKEEIAAGRFAGAVHYLGQLPHDDAVKLISASDVVVLASVWPENEPVTLLEAIASGTAQLASRIGGIPELVVDDKSGLLFEPGNAIDLAEKMRLYILNPALATQHGAWNQDRRAEFDEARTLDRLQQLYDEETGPRRFDGHVVICAGAWSVEINALLRRVHVIEEGRIQIRFIWHEWADASAWREARLLWLWGGSTPLPLLRRALGQGLPVLAPAGSMAQQIESVSTAVIGYATYLEGLAMLAALIASPDPPHEPAPHLARLLATIAPSETFYLPTDARA